MASNKNNNPTGKGGFGDNPQNRSNGTWSSEDSISFQYKKMSRMSFKELTKWMAENKETATVAQLIAYNALHRAQRSLQDLKEITDRTEGKAPQSIDVTSGGEALTPIVVEFAKPDESN